MIQKPNLTFWQIINMNAEEADIHIDDLPEGEFGFEIHPFVSCEYRKCKLIAREDKNKFKAKSWR